MKKTILLLTLCIFLISCVPEEKPELECTSDLDCATGGCSGQVCGAKDKVKDIITTCEYLEEYGCLKLTSCSCIDNKCEWEGNIAYKECIDNLKIKT